MLLNAAPVGAQTGQVSQTELEDLKALIELQTQQIETQQHAVERQQKQIETQRGLIQAQQQRLDALEATTSNLKAVTLSLYDSVSQPAYYQPAVAGGARYGTGSEGYARRGWNYAGYTGGTGAVQPAVVRTETQRAQVEEGQAGAPGGQTRPAKELQIPAIAERATALTTEGTLVFEPSIEYNTTSLNRVILEGFTVIPAITIGNIDIRKVDRSVLTGAVALRYGVTDLFELDAKVPYVYREDSTTSRPLAQGASEDVTTEVTGNGLGDIEFSAHYQVVAGTGGWPFVILNGRVKAPTGTDPFEVGLDSSGLETELPTGTGFWGLEPGVTVLFPSDPVVFFATTSYLFNLSDTKTLQSGASVDVDPGDAVRFSMGMGFAINERASFSLGYEHSFVFESEVDGEDIDGSDLQVGSLLVGTSYRVSDNTTVNLSVGIGATEEAPDVSLLLRVPMSWKLY